MSSESVNPIHASPRPTNFTTTELPSTMNGLFAASARHQVEPRCFAPKLFQRVKVRGRRAELRKAERDLAAPDFIREFEQ